MPSHYAHLSVSVPDIWYSSCSPWPILMLGRGLSWAFMNCRVDTSLTSSGSVAVPGAECDCSSLMHGCCLSLLGADWCVEVAVALVI